MLALRGMQAVGGLVLLLGVSSASGDPDAAPTCSYCTCLYYPHLGGRLYEVKPITKDVQCLDWCREHHPIYHWDLGHCYWDEESDSCETHCPHCHLPGGCYQTNTSECIGYKTKKQCLDGGYGGPTGCSCALKAGVDACYPCYQCQCSYAMGTVTVNASYTHRVQATPEICAKRCQEHGKGFGQGSWGKCGQGTEPMPGPEVSPIGWMEEEDQRPDDLAQCDSWGCHASCKVLGDTCQTTVDHKCNGTTQCSCPLLGSEVHPNCPTRVLPPVNPSPAMPPPVPSSPDFRAWIEAEEEGHVGPGEVVVEEGDYDGRDARQDTGGYQQHYCPRHNPHGPTVPASGY